jgi:cytidylate kinase
MTLVALSAAYGAAGSEIAPALARRLGVPFVDRAIPVAIAERLDISVEEALAYEQEAAPSLLERLLSGFVGGDPTNPTPIPAELITPDDFHQVVEQELRRQATTGEGVILGRAAVVVLRDDPRVLRVRLTGPGEARVRQAMRLGDVDEETARTALRRLDRAHAEYVRRFYGVDLDDPSLYHLVIDSTAIAPPACVDLIATATRAVLGAP